MKIQELNTNPLNAFKSLSIWPCVHEGGEIERIRGTDPRTPDFHSIYASDGSEDQWLMDMDDFEDTQTMYRFLVELIRKSPR